MMHTKCSWTISDECQDSCQPLVSGFWQFPIVLYAFLTFPLPLWTTFFFSMWSQAEVKIWWIAFITSGGTAGIFCVKKEGKPFEWREIYRIAHFVKITSEASWFLARKSKQPGGLAVKYLWRSKINLSEKFKSTISGFHISGNMSFWFTKPF